MQKPQFPPVIPSDLQGLYIWLLGALLLGLSIFISAMLGQNADTRDRIIRVEEKVDANNRMIDYRLVQIEETLKKAPWAVR